MILKRTTHSTSSDTGQQSKTNNSLSKQCVFMLFLWLVTGTAVVVMWWIHRLDSSTLSVNEFTCLISALSSELNHLSSQRFFYLQLCQSVSIHFHPFTALSESLPSVSSTTMLIKWTECNIQIPMAVFLPSALSASPLCLPEGIIHLALSLYTMLSGCTHWLFPHTDTDWCLYGCKVTGGKHVDRIQLWRNLIKEDDSSL